MAPTGSPLVAHPAPACGGKGAPEDKLERMQQAVRVVLEGLGEDVEREGLRDTPKVCWRPPRAAFSCTWSQW